eukprot:TRINITY_DN2392_c0_g2_i2.p1 TRINITY_DN2392_c0_g2~~TRINITY_DN2392_c0_g2_i2.p1  ORF type:complete len:344 (-),score=-2.12 TRINITY_DN2392_c0_g2_i2:113-1045(-)
MHSGVGRQLKLKGWKPSKLLQKPCQAQGCKRQPFGHSLVQQRAQVYGTWSRSFNQQGDFPIQQASLNQPLEDYHFYTTQCSASKVWARRLSAPETGCVLVGHPCMYPSSPDCFKYAVILIIQHDENGSIGLVLNKPYQLSLKEFQTNREQPSLLSPEFDNNQVFFGGVVNQCIEFSDVMLPSAEFDPLFLMHTHQQLEGSREVIRGVRIGGIEAAKKAVAQGEHNVKNFKIFNGFSGWEQDQLIDEINTRCWFCASVSPSLIFNQKDVSEMWYNILEAMGSEYCAISLAVRAMFREEFLSQQLEDQQYYS